MSALSPLTPQNTVRGQYQGYLDVAGVAPSSTVETYVAVRLAADTWRWAGVPILIRAGKCLPVTATEMPSRSSSRRRNLRDRAGHPRGHAQVPGLARDRAVSLTVHGKKPGAGLGAEAEQPDVRPAARTDIRPYDRLIGAALDGDRWLFARQDTVESAWQIVDPVLGDAGSRCTRTPGSWGPTRRRGCCPPGKPGTTRRADTRTDAPD